MKQEPRVAIVSDPLVQRGGAERVVEAMASAFPSAPIYALLYSEQRGPASLSSKVSESWLGKIPGATSRHRLFLPFYRQAIESFDLSSFETILSSHHTVAKGALIRSDQTHVCYCHTPMRALWERPSQELATLPLPLRPLASMLFSDLRVWDTVTASRVDHFIANSFTTKRRIAKYYRRSSVVINPPIDTDFFEPGGEVGDYYLVASRPVPYKRVDIAIEATRRLRRKLVIVGGRHRVANPGPHVTLLGHVDDRELRDLMRGARALLFPQYEDFGMTPLEVNACGRPVVAFGAGGALETIVDGKNGVLSAEQTVESFTHAMKRFESDSFDPQAIRNHALTFSRATFTQRLRDFISEAHQIQST